MASTTLCMCDFEVHEGPRSVLTRFLVSGTSDTQ